MHLDPSDELSPEMQRRIVDLLHKHLMDTGELLLPGHGDATTESEDRPRQAATEQGRLLDEQPIVSAPGATMSVKND